MALRCIHRCVCSRKIKAPSGFDLTKFFSGSAALTAEIDTGQSTAIKPLVGRDFLNLHHWKADDIKHILWVAKDLKFRIKENEETFLPLSGKTAALMFHKCCNMTRLSAELGIAKLGGHAAVLGPEYSKYGDDGVSLQESVRSVAGMADVILATTLEQEDLIKMADESIAPVINGSSDLLHPLQTLAIFMTIQEHFGYLYGCPISWIGDSNSVLHSLMQGCARMGVDLNIATPAGYEPHPDIIIDAIKLAGTTGASLQMGNKPVDAAYRTDVIITDTWFRSERERGKEGEDREKRMKDFQGFQVNRKMLKEAGGNWVFMHCLPRQPEEVTDNLFNGDEALVWQLAENRMWTIMALMLCQLQVYTPTIPMPKFVRG